MRDLPLTRKDFQLLAKLRAKEAGTLSKNGDDQGAYYLAGYAIECALKACIAKKSKRWEFPPKRKYVDQVYTHDLNLLLQAAELGARHESDGFDIPCVPWQLLAYSYSKPLTRYS
jgi:hypothetical protein